MIIIVKVLKTFFIKASRTVSVKSLQKPPASLIADAGGFYSFWLRVYFFNAA